MKTPTTNPTPDQVRQARIKVGMSQREASLAVFGADSSRSFQNWESGARTMALGTWILFLLMTNQVTLEQVQAVIKPEGEERRHAR